MNTLPFLDFETLKNLGVFTLVTGIIVGLLNHFIVSPYRNYYAFRDELTRGGMRLSGIILNTGLPKETYNQAFDEINEWLGEMNVIKNRLLLNNYLSRLGIPSDDEIDEAIGLTAFIRNALGQQRFIVDIFNNYNRIMEIYDINQ